MKKSLFILLGVTLLITGCSSNGDHKDSDTSTTAPTNEVLDIPSDAKTMHCTRSIDQDGIKLDLDYTLTYKDNEVFTLSAKEYMEADEDTLNSVKESAQNIYDTYKDLEYYSSSVKIDNGKLTSTLDINYAKINQEEIIKRDSANAQYFKDGKADLSAFKEIYKQLGMECK